MFKRTAFFFVCITQILSSHAQGEKVCCGKAGNPVQSCGFLQPNAGTVVAGGSAAIGEWACGGSAEVSFVVACFSTASVAS